MQIRSGFGMYGHDTSHSTASHCFGPHAKAECMLQRVCRHVVQTIVQLKTRVQLHGRAVRKIATCLTTGRLRFGGICNQSLTTPEAGAVRVARRY